MANRNIFIVGGTSGIGLEVVNALALSLTDTPLAQDLLSSDERRKASAERHPLKRIGTPAEVAGFVTYLLSDTPSWITGQIIPVDGGLSALRTFR
jgi:NAD(P)-dependent dehydrogenase (short-subunit alcohol dehydrogenase family)